MSNRRREGKPSALEALSAGAQNTPSEQGNIYSSLLKQIEATDPEMAQRAIVQEDGGLQLGSFRITPLGLIGGERATETEWRKLGSALFRLHDSLQIILGDWLVQGERIHGKTYEEIANLFGRKKKTLYNWKYVMSSVDISLRGENLTFKHYRIVAAMPPEQQAYWLGQAAASNWGAGKMQDEIDKANPPQLVSGSYLHYSPEVMNESARFFARVERIKRALDGQDNPDDEAMWEYITDIEAFVKVLRKNFGWDEQ